ncbi:MAG: hypothetical protein DI606_19715 [Sphingobium sp.]|nr:MAG: hypothetical protein DI606_19715 [Sphingobium sp.]
MLAPRCREREPSTLSAFRVHRGGEGQAVDPLIASAVGEAHAPAHRGIAYALFEDLALADYGNRIPSLTFEVEADDAPVALAQVAAQASGGRVSGVGLGLVEGYAASGADMVEALAPLIEARGLALTSGEAGLRLRAAADGASGTIRAEALTARVNGRSVDPEQRSSGAVDAVPVALSLRHYDAARDCQTGVQRVVRPGAGRQEQGIDLPEAMSADRARALTAARLNAAWSGRARMDLRCGWDALAWNAGDVVRVDRAPGLWRIEEREWEAMAVRLALRRVPGAGGTLPAGASPGAIVRQEDAPHGPTSLMLVDLPPLRDGVASAPSIAVAASGGPGWRSAALFVTGASGEAVPAGRSAGRGVMGRVETLLAPGSATLVDRRATLDVMLLADDMMLAPADEAMLGQGRNLCLVGRELIQFEAAAKTGARRWRLTGLRRGLRGTEWAAGDHRTGESFLLIEEDRLADPLHAVGQAADLGATLRVAALGLGDVEPVEAMMAVTGEALIPPAPVHLTAQAVTGGVTLRWVRRSRAGWRWSSGSDVPLAEESERYVVRLMQGEQAVRDVETSVPTWTYDAAAIAADGSAGSALTVEVAQLGTHATGRAARIAIMV